MDEWMYLLLRISTPVRCCQLDALLNSEKAIHRMLALACVCMSFAGCTPEVRSDAATLPTCFIRCVSCMTQLLFDQSEISDFNHGLSCHLPRQVFGRYGVQCKELI